MPSTANQHFSSGSLVVEGIIIGGFCSNIFIAVPSETTRWIFITAAILLVLFYTIRAASTIVEDPNTGRVRRTIPWSITFLRICTVGVIANAAIRLSAVGLVFENLLLNFIIIGTAIIIFVVVIDEIFFGSYISTWAKIIAENTSQNQIGKLQREAAAFCIDALDSAGGGNDKKSVNIWRGARLFVFLSLTLSLFVIPIAYISAGILGSGLITIFVVIVLMLLRNTTYYLYFNLGPGESFSSVKATPSMSTLIMLLNIALVAEALTPFP